MKPIDIDKAPSRLAMQHALQVIKLGSAFLVPPTGLGLVVEGGVGIAWGDERTACDLEIYNDGSSAYSVRMRGSSAHFEDVDLGDEGEIRSMLEAIRRWRDGS